MLYGFHFITFQVDVDALAAQVEYSTTLRKEKKAQDDAEGARVVAIDKMIMGLQANADARRRAVAR